MREDMGGLCSLRGGAAVVAAAVVLTLSGCGAHDDGETESVGSVAEAITTRSLTVTVPAGKRASDVVASGASSLKLDDRSALRVTGGSFPFSSSLGSATLEVGADAITGSLTAKGPVFLRERARVNGDLITGGAKTAQGNQTVVTGSVSQFAPVTSKTWTRSISFPDTTLGPVSLEPNQTRVILPGAYDDLSIKSNAKLYLSSGSYYFKTFTTEPQAKIYLDQSRGGIYVYVLGNSFLRNTWVQNGGASADFLFGYLGSSMLTVESPFVGTIIAPNAKLELKEVGSSGHTGAFFAKDLEVFSQATVWKKAMPSGIWDGADPCSFGLPAGDTCNTKAACPVSGRKSCDGQDTCGCVAPGGNTSSCLIEQPAGSGTSRYVPAAAGTVCFGPGGTGACNSDGYCIVKTSTQNDGSSCTDDQSAGGGQYTHTPLANGTACTEAACTAGPSTCEAGVCACAKAVADDGNECTADSCSGSQCTHTPIPILIGKKCHNGDCIGTCGQSGACTCDAVSPAPAGAPVRVLTANVAALPNTAGLAPTLGFSDCHTNWLGDSDYECLANHLAEKVLASNYDIVVLNEAFDDTYQDAIFDALHGDASDGKFPYVIKKLDASGWLGGWNAYNDSGLMMFSKWPFDKQVGGENDCFDVDSNVDVIGAEYETVTTSTGRGGLGTFSRNISAVGFRPFDGGEAEEGADAFVNKGVGFARVVAPTGFRYDIFFSHLQATYGSDSSEDWRDDRVGARRLQFSIARNLMTCLHDIGGAKAMVLAGDLNVNGDVSNPYFDPDDHSQIGSDCTVYPATTCDSDLVGPDDECSYLGDQQVRVCVGEKTFRERRNNNRAEWDYYFNRSPGGFDFFKTELLDSWAHAMQEQSCLPSFGGPVPAACVPKLVDPNDLIHQGLKGDVDYDRGFSWANQESEERLDYILFGSGKKTSAKRFGEFAPQHISKAYNIWDGYAFEGGITQHPPAGESAPLLGGEQLLSDHIGLNGEIDYATPYSNPADAYLITYAPRGELEMRLERQGVAQWFRIDEPGAYTFSVNPVNHFPPRPSNGITYRVYTADELSKPRLPYKGELLTQQPYKSCYAGTGEFRDCYEVPGFTEAKFRVLKAPLFIKVYHESRDYESSYTGRYLFLYKRAQCTSRDEACDLVPYVNQPFEMTYEVNEGWFSFHVDKPDFLASQDLKLIVDEGAGATAQSVLSIAVMDESGNPLLNGAGVPIELTRDGGTGRWTLANAGRTLEARSDGFFGSKFYLKVTRNPTVTTAFKLALKTTTDLTWLYGPELGGAPGAIHCNNSQEVGDDEIWIAALANGADFGFPRNGADTTELNGAFDEDENDEWTKKLFHGGYRLGAQRRPKAALFTEYFKVRLFEDDYQDDETADRTFSALGDVIGSTLAPSGWWNFPKVFLVNKGSNYKGTGPTLSHYLEGRVCETNADCQAPLICGGSLCTRP
jgi:hypothetical protein